MRLQIPHLKSYFQKPDLAKLLWWAVCLSLNFIIFLPRAVWGEWQFLEEWSRREGFYRHITIFFRRESDDIFRLSQELIFLLWISILFKGKKTFQTSITWFITLVYVLFVSYELYFVIFKKFYAFKPIFSNDIALLRFGFHIIWEDTPLLVVLGFLVFTVITIGLFLIFRYQVSAFWKFSIHRNLLFRILIILCLTTFIKLHLMPLLRPEKLHIPIERNATFNLVSFDILRNLTQSIIVDRKVAAFDVHDLTVRNESLDTIDLVEKPNIYLFFIESYGGVLYEDPEFRTVYKPFLSELELRLNSGGFHFASDFSESPVTGGASWLGYGSALFGAEISYQALYQRLVYDTTFYKVNNVFKWLKKSGYRSYYAAPSVPGKYVPDRSVYTAYYGVDQWITHQDFQHFKGRRYGWNSPPPDQYVINYAHEKYLEEKEPHVFFYLTKNSHSPFLSPEKASGDWRALKEEKGDNPAHFVDRPVRKDYPRSINYELDVLTKFAMEKTSGNDIVVLMGDHQPPFFTPKDANKLTPVHFLSRYPKPIEYLLDHGFHPSIDIAGKKSEMKHQDLLWLLAYALESMQPRSNDVESNNGSSVVNHHDQ